MTSRSGRTLAVLALSLLAARGAVAKNLFSTVDSKLSAIDQAEGDLARCKPSASSPVAAPPPPIKFDAASVAKPPMPATPAQSKAQCMKRDVKKFIEDKNFLCAAQKQYSSLQSYYECKSVADKAPAQCGSAGGLATIARVSGDTDCHVDSAKLLLGRALITRDPGAAELCKQAFLAESGADKLCPVLIAHNGDAAGACAAAKAAGVKNAEDPSCVPLAGMYWGAASCETLPGSAELKHVCSELKLFAAARASGGAARCGASGICRALLGEGDASCGRYLTGLERQYCASIWDAKEREADYQLNLTLWHRAVDAAVMDAQVKETARQRAISDAKARIAAARPAVEPCSALVDGVRKGLDDAIAMLDHMEPKSIRGFEERRARIATLQNRLSELRKRALAPVNKDKGPSEPAKGAPAKGSKPASRSGR
jgi:hypothetical protein